MSSKNHYAQVQIDTLRAETSTFVQTLKEQEIDHCSAIKHLNSDTVLHVGKRAVYNASLQEFSQG